MAGGATGGVARRSEDVARRSAVNKADFEEAAFVKGGGGGGGVGVAVVVEALGARLASIKEQSMLEARQAWTCIN